MMDGSAPLRELTLDGLIVPELPEIDPGRPPKLGFVAIADLIVDPDYQRPISRAGRSNITRIARAFDWAKFSPIIVAPCLVPGLTGRLAIVDGQHRTLAALMRGFERVPASTIEASRAGQASVFAAVNGNVTRMSPLNIFRAGLAAGDPEFVEIDRVCRAAGVRVAPYPKAAHLMDAGETLSAAVLRRLMRQHGAEVLGLALACLMGGKGAPKAEENCGHLGAALITAMVKLVAGLPATARARPEGVIAGFAGLSMPLAVDQAERDDPAIGPLWLRIMRVLGAHLTAEVARAGRGRAA